MADGKNETQITPAKVYGDVIITLENCVIPVEKLSPTPSVRDGLDPDTEMSLRVLGCEFIQTAGILLKLPQVAMATGQVIFQRFYYSKSFVKHNMEIVAMACINLASKIEEAPRRIRDVINVFHHIRQKRNNKLVEPMVLDQKYLNMKNQVIKAERRVLKELGFCVHIKHPHKMIVTYLQVLECERNAELVQKSWNYMNDSLRTDVFVKYQPETIACACIYLTARQLGIILPSNPPWFGLVGADEEELKEIARTILRLYFKPRKSYEELDRVVERCRLAMQEAKIAKLKGDKLDPNSAAGTPNNFSPHSSRQASPKVNSESPNLPSSYKAHRVKEEPASGGSGQSSHKERNGKVAHRSKSGMSNSRSHSKSPRHGGRSDPHSSASGSSSRSHSRSRSRSLHNDKHYSSHSGKHKKKDEHKRSRRDRDRDRDRDHSRDHERKYPKAKSRSRKRKHSRSSSRDSRSRSRSRSPIRRNKYDSKDSPIRESKSKDKHRRQRSRSREQSRKTGKRDSSGHSRSRDRRRR